MPVATIETSDVAVVYDENGKMMPLPPPADLDDEYYYS
jgi:hypothetical protein